MKLIKYAAASVALFVSSYVLAVILVLLTTYLFFRDASPRLEAVLLVYGVLIPLFSIAGTVVGVLCLVKRDRRRKTRIGPSAAQ